MKGLTRVPQARKGCTGIRCEEGMKGRDKKVPSSQSLRPIYNVPPRDIDTLGSVPIDEVRCHRAGARSYCVQIFLLGL